MSEPVFKTIAPEKKIASDLFSVLSSNQFPSTLAEILTIFSSHLKFPSKSLNVTYEFAYERIANYLKDQNGDSYLQVSKSQYIEGLCRNKNDIVLMLGSPNHFFEFLFYCKEANVLVLFSSQGTLSTNLLFLAKSIQYMHKRRNAVIGYIHIEKYIDHKETEKTIRNYFGVQILATLFQKAEINSSDKIQISFDCLCKKKFEDNKNIKNFNHKCWNFLSLNMGKNLMFCHYREHFNENLKLIEFNEISLLFPYIGPSLLVGTIGKEIELPFSVTTLENDQSDEELSQDRNSSERQSSPLKVTKKDESSNPFSSHEQTESKKNVIDKLVECDNLGDVIFKVYKKEKIPVAYRLMKKEIEKNPTLVDLWALNARQMEKSFLMSFFHRSRLIKALTTEQSKKPNVLEYNAFKIRHLPVSFEDKVKYFKIKGAKLYRGVGSIVTGTPAEVPKVHELKITCKEKLPVEVPQGQVPGEAPKVPPGEVPQVPPGDTMQDPGETSQVPRREARTPPPSTSRAPLPMSTLEVPAPPSSISGSSTSTDKVSHEKSLPKIDKSQILAMAVQSIEEPMETETLQSHETSSSEKLQDKLFGEKEDLKKWAKDLSQSVTLKSPNKPSPIYQEELLNVPRDGVPQKMAKRAKWSDGFDQFWNKDNSNCDPQEPLRHLRTQQSKKGK